MADKLVFYFGFASNISKQKMLSRGCKFESREAGILKNYCLKYNCVLSDGYAYGNIEPRENSVVHGGLYAMKPAALEENDRDHVKSGFCRRVVVPVVRSNGEVVEAFAYQANGEFIKEGVKPSREYVETILEGSDILPEKQVQALREILKTCTS